MPRHKPLVLVEKGAGEQFTPNPIESVRRSNLVGFGNDDAANLKDFGRVKKADLRDFGIENPADIKGLGKAGKVALAGFGVDGGDDALEEAAEDYKKKKDRESEKGEKGDSSGSSGDSDKDERDRRRKAVIAERGNPAKREPSKGGRKGRGKKHY